MRFSYPPTALRGIRGSAPYESLKTKEAEE